MMLFFRKMMMISLVALAAVGPATTQVQAQDLGDLIEGAIVGGVIGGVVGGKSGAKAGSALGAIGGVIDGADRDDFLFGDGY